MSATPKSKGNLATPSFLQPSQAANGTWPGDGLAIDDEGIAALQSFKEVYRGIRRRDAQHAAETRKEVA